MLLFHRFERVVGELLLVIFLLFSTVNLLKNTIVFLVCSKDLLYNEGRE